ncbi:DUF1491 family protein [Litorimonas sp. WD9-15]|uniref:DUF1491 family protein n=1 Tax=Litorimonas sp. WD9-15 TaxID=3418716 RepID=UPI003D002E19
MARLKTEIRATALLRRAQGAGAFAAVLRRGDPDAGALWVVTRQGGILHRYVEQMSMSGGREWFRDGPFTEDEQTLRINKAVDRDPDLWIVEVEDSQGRAFLDGDIAKPETAAEAAAKALFRGR